MAADIFIKNQFIEIPWQVFSDLYDVFNFISKRDHFATKHPNINKMLDFMSTVISNPCNGCFDLSDFLINSEDVIILIHMLKEAQHNLQHKYSMYVTSELNKLNQYLLVYYNDLK